MKKQVRTVTEGAMMLAIIGVVLYLNRMSGQALMGFLVFILPLPSIFYIAKYGPRQGLILSFVILLFPILIGDFVALFYTTTAVAVGLVYGYGVYKDKDNGWLVITATIVTAISLYFEIYLLQAFIGEDFIGELRLILEQFLVMANEAGLKGIPDNFMTLTLSLVPMMALIMSFGQAFVTHIAALILLQRLKIKTRKMRPLTEWVIPTKYAIFLAIGIFANLGVQYTTNETLQILFNNVYFVSSLAFCIDAYIFVLFYARVSGKKLFVLLAILVLFLPPFGISIGLFDSFTDLRKRVLYNYAKPLR